MPNRTGASQYDKASEVAKTTKPNDGPHTRCPYRDAVKSEIGDFEFSVESRSSSTKH